jgi:hypothetical protein
MALLNIENLSVDFATSGGTFRAVDALSLTVAQKDICWRIWLWKICSNDGCYGPIALDRECDG